MAMFTVGEVYRRVQDIHELYGGQRQGGISTPKDQPLVFLFTGDSGSTYGYRDEFRSDGSFWYTGEGQTGDMEMRGGNAAIRDHAAAQKAMHLFEYVAAGRVRYVGEAIYLDHHIEQRHDRKAALRDAIIFELAIETDLQGPEVEAPKQLDPSPQTLRLWSRPLGEVRSLAVQRAAATSQPAVRRQIIRQRSEAVRVYVLRRAQGVCEGCGNPAPFKNRQGRPYLEPHHIHRLADGGPDHPSYVAALCPTCHRRIHYGRDGASYNKQVATYVGGLE